MLSRLFVIVVLLMIGIPDPTSAQDSYVDDQTGQSMILQYKVGGYGGALLNIHNVSFGALPGYASCCTSFENTALPGLAAGVLGEYRIDESMVLDGRFGYSTLSATFQRNQLIGNEPVLTDGPVGTPDRRDVVVQHVLSSSIALITLEPTLRYGISGKMSVIGGIRAGYALGPTFEQQEILISPEGYVFADGSAVRNQQSGVLPTATTVNLHATVGAHYELFKSQTYSFGLDLRYYYPITDVAAVDWSVQALHAGMSIAFGVYKPIDAIQRFDTIYVRDTTVAVTKGITREEIVLATQQTSEDSRRMADTLFTVTTVRESYVRRIPRPFDPGLQVQIFGRDTENNAVETSSLRIEEMDVIESYPMLPQIFFAEGSAILGQTGQQLLDTVAMRTFSSGTLTRNQFSVYSNLLNIIGQRMSLAPEAKITIYGYGSNQGPEQGNREIARSRAEAVRSYLSSVWGIETSRVAIKAGLLPPQPANSATADGRAENQRIEISANDVSVLEPVEFRDRDLTFTPKTLLIKPTINEADEVATWRFSLEQGGRQLAAQDGQEELKEYIWDPQTSLSRPRREQPLIAKYIVTNAQGAEIESRDTLAVDYVTLQMIRSRREEGKLIERYSLIVFDFNSAQLSPANQRTMERVKARIQPESKVRIVGYADRTGNPEYNRTLAKRRCLEAQRVLGVADDRVTIDPIGSDVLVYNNDTPEGRSYSRTVQIEIETPIK